MKPSPSQFLRRGFDLYTQKRQILKISSLKFNIMKNLKIGIQKSGKLTKNSLVFLKNLGIKFNYDPNKLNICSTNFPIEIFFLRDDDIPNLVEIGILDFGIVGENLIVENNLTKVKVLEKLTFGQCRLSIVVPKNFEYKSIQDLNGTRIATSYPHTLFSFLKENKIVALIYKMKGAVEIAPSLGVADLICDLIDTGKTIEDNGLREVEIIFRSKAIIISSIKSIFTLEKCIEILKEKNGLHIYNKESEKYSLHNMGH